MPDTIRKRMTLAVVSNRLPFSIYEEDGRMMARQAGGGLVTALVPVLKSKGGVWIGWNGGVGRDKEKERLFQKASKESGYRVESIPLTEQERDMYYLGYCNEVLWPLFHDLIQYCRFDPEYWPYYRWVNRKFAKAIKKHVQPGRFIWIQDYHLMALARELREMGVHSRCGFFLHIPFPPLDMFLRLPWRKPILEALLHFDLLGFQTVRDRRNFVQCVDKLLPNVIVKGKGQVQQLKVFGRTIKIGAFPIGIDFKEFSQHAQSHECAVQERRIREHLPKRKLILGVDRLDYTKGVPDRLLAFANALQRYPELQGRITLIQVLVPSREEIPGYFSVKEEVEQLVGRINGEFARPGWIPIHYMFQRLTREELLGYYRASDIALVTSLKDGMNLVSKEFVACQVTGDDGVLILSEFAGSAAQLQRGAILVNPYDVIGVADAIYEAFRMQPEERRARMRKLRRIVRNSDIYRWVESVLDAGFVQDVDDQPQVEDFVPRI